jgi:hypothetical protein
MLKKIIYYVLGHNWLQIWYPTIIQLEKLFLKMHYKPIQKGHMCNLVLEKDSDLVASDSFYCDYTHMIVREVNYCMNLKFELKA